MTAEKVLIIDDEPAMLRNCERFLTAEGFECETLPDATQARVRLRELQPDVLLLDLRMPRVDGMTVLTVALAEDPALPVVIMSAYATVSSAVQVIREGAFDCLAKPFTRTQLVIAVQRALGHRRLALENRALREQVGREGHSEEIVGSSPGIEKLLERSRRVARKDANIVITGETGTGKELLARFIHEHSARKSKPFVPVDCAALPEGLLESELFGYERGAFTGADSRKIGLVETAHRGTVFLDEVTELSLSLQSKLLRMLEERQIRRLGSSQLVDIDIRIIAASNVDMETAVTTGEFREDLYYRLNVVPLHLPPLRERGGDLVTLAQRFLARYSAADGRPPPEVTPDVWEALERYGWPGNVRELRNVAERVIALNDDGRVTMADLPIALRPGTEFYGSDSERTPPPYHEARDQTMRRFQAAYVKSLLDAADGNVSAAARAAGVSRRTVQRWMEGIDDQ